MQPGATDGVADGDGQGDVVLSIREVRAGEAGPAGYTASMLSQIVRRGVRSARRAPSTDGCGTRTAFPAPTRAPTKQRRSGGPGPLRRQRRSRRWGTRRCAGAPAPPSPLLCRRRRTRGRTAFDGSRDLERPSAISCQTTEATIGLVQENTNRSSLVASPNVSSAISSPSRATATWQAGSQPLSTLRRAVSGCWRIAAVMSSRRSRRTAR